jgi:hypothetical protein
LRPYFGDVPRSRLSASVRSGYLGSASLLQARPVEPSRTDHYRSSAAHPVGYGSLRSGSRGPCSQVTSMMRRNKINIYIDITTVK